jgi:hypothetical protein
MRGKNLISRALKCDLKRHSYRVEILREELKNFTFVAGSLSVQLEIGALMSLATMSSSLRYGNWQVVRFIEINIRILLLEGRGKI